MKAKVLALLVTAALVLQLAACGGSPSSSTTSSIAYLGYPPLVSQGYMTGLEENDLISTYGQGTATNFGGGLEWVKRLHKDILRFLSQAAVRP